MDDKMKAFMDSVERERPVSGPDDKTIQAMQEASPALQEWWKDSDRKYPGERHTRRGVTWSGLNSSDDSVLELDLGGCPLEVLPPEIGQLKALTKLDLSNCPLKELPPEIGQLKALTVLFLEGCPLKELPSEIGLLLALNWLDLEDCNQLTLAPGAKKGQPPQTIVAAYARLLIVESRKDAPAQILSAPTT